MKKLEGLIYGSSILAGALVTGFTGYEMINTPELYIVENNLGLVEKVGIGALATIGGLTGGAIAHNVKNNSYL